MRAQFARTMAEVGQEDSQLVVMVSDIGVFGLRDFANKCPGRFFNAGIREGAMASAAAGLALTGYIPVIHSITPFVVERCFEQIKDDFCYQRLPGNIVSVGGGIEYAALGGTHHCYSDISLMKSLPGTQVFVPGSALEFDSLFRQSYGNGLVNYFRLSERSHGLDIGTILPGKGYRIREGKDITLVASGSLVAEQVKAAEELAGVISCEIIYLPSVKPLDSDLLKSSVAKTRRVVVAEDHNVYGGIGDEVRRALSNLGSPYAFESLGIQDCFLRDYGSFKHLAAVAGIDSAAIIATVRKVCGYA